MKTSQEHDARHPDRRLRLPHERDESPDSQSAGQRTRIRQAARDVNAGRGVSTHSTPGDARASVSPRQARQARPHLHEADPADRTAPGTHRPTRKN